MISWPTSILRRALYALFLSFFSLAASAGPKVLERTSSSVLPDPPGAPALYFIKAIAMDGDRIVVGDFGREFGGPLRRIMYLYERNASGEWIFVRQLLDVPGAEQAPPIQVALKGNIAAATFINELHILELTPAGWVHTALAKPPSVGVMGSTVAVDGNTVVVGGATGHFQGIVFRKNPSGQWQHVATLSAGPAPSHAIGSDVDISGDTVAVSSGGSAFVFTEMNGAWSQQAELPGAGAQGFGYGLELEDDTLVLIDGANIAADDMHVFLRSAGVWSYASSVRNPVMGTMPGGVVVAGDLIVLVSHISSRGSALAYQRDGTELQRVAELRVNAPVTIPEPLQVSGRTVTTLSTESQQQVISEYILPTDLSQPAVVQDNFQDGNANGWNPSVIANWSVATNGSSHVYRQTTFASGSRTVLSNVVWTDQAAQAEVTPTAVQIPGRWVGVGVRHQDENNYYYMALRSTNVVQLVKKVNGTFITIAEEPFTFTLNRRYRLRVEAIGTRLRAFIDDQPVLDAVDTSIAQGSPALLTWGARADFDNVVITPNPLRTLFTDDFFEGSSSNDRFPWVEEFGTWVDPPSVVDPEGPDPDAHLRHFSQTSTSGKGRAYFGEPTDDMSVQVIARAVSPMVKNGWFGVMARRTDDRNFYYLRLGEGRVALRKYVNGAFSEIASVPFTVSTNVTYTLRLEVVGTTLRGYVNGRFLVEGTDSSHATGNYGLATHLNAVQFKAFAARQP